MNPLIRFGALAGATSGLLIAIASAIEIVTGEIVSTSLALGVAPALALPLLFALHLGQLDASGRLGQVGFAINLLGLGLFGGAGFALNLVLVHVDSAVVESLPVIVTLALLASAVVFSVGTVIFGIAMLRARVYPRIAALAYTCVLPLIALLAPLPDNLATSVAHVVSGVGLVWLAASLPREAPRPVAV